MLYSLEDRRVLERKSNRRKRRGVKRQEVGGENTAVSHSATIAPGPLLVLEGN